MKTIVIDAGHGGKDPGAISNCVNEKDLNISIAKELEKKLFVAGYKVIMTRSDDVFIPLYKRARIANDADADIFVSIHNNAAANESAHGIETLYYPDSIKGEKLAGLVQEQLLKNLQRPDRMIKERKDLVVLSSTKMTAILVECGFVTNSTERKLLQDNGYQLLAAEAIFNGIVKYFEEGNHG